MSALYRTVLCVAAALAICRADTINNLACPPLGPDGYIPQVADGAAGGSSWKSTIVFVNGSGGAAAFKLAFFAADGRPLEMRFGPTTRASVYCGIVLPLGITTVETEGADQELQQGWVEVTYPAISSSVTTILRQRVVGRPDFEAAVPIVPSLSFRFYVPFDDTSGLTTSVALINANSSLGAVITATARDELGRVIASSDFSVPRRGHTAFPVVSQIPAVAGRRGSIEFASSGAPISGMALRFNSGGAFTILSGLGR